eukprot:6464790-Amphidinium_carterae.1
MSASPSVEESCNAFKARAWFAARKNSMNVGQKQQNLDLRHPDRQGAARLTKWFRMWETSTLMGSTPWLWAHHDDDGLVHAELSRKAKEFEDADARKCS